MSVIPPQDLNTQFEAKYKDSCKWLLIFWFISGACLISILEVGMQWVSPPLRIIFALPAAIQFLTFPMYLKRNERNGVKERFRSAFLATGKYPQSAWNARNGLIAIVSILAVTAVGIWWLNQFLHSTALNK